MKKHKLKFSLSSLLMFMAFVGIVVAFVVAQRTSKERIRHLESRIVILEELSDLKSQLAEVKERYPGEHPRVVSLIRRIQEVEADLQK